jgi:hypothetical protein
MNAEDRKVKTKIQRISDRFFFDATYDPPVWRPEEDPDFDIDETIYFYGMRREGKSTLSRYIALLLRRLYPIVFVFSGTAETNFWQQVVPENKVFSVDFDKEMKHRTLNTPCEQILEINMRRMSSWKQAQAKHKSTGNPVLLVIGDDVVTDDTIRQCPAVTRIMLNGRHHGIAAWILSQRWAGMTPAQRNNLDRVVLFKATDPAVEEWVLLSYGAHVLEMYRRVVEEPFTAFVIVNKARVDGTRFYKIRADIDYVEKMLGQNKVLGNTRMWQGIDIEEQKQRLPDVRIAKKKTLLRRFDEAVGERSDDELGEDDEAMHGVTIEQPDPEETEPQAAEVFRSW